MTQLVVRIDDATERALRQLVELTGRKKSEIVRDTIQSAARMAVLERARKQADEVRDDADDRREMLALADEMESLRAW